jgi:hypothetical protein
VGVLGRLLVPLFAMLFLSALHAQDIRRCKDATGKTVFQNEPCDVEIAKEISSGREDAERRRRASTAWHERMKREREELAKKPIPKEALIPSASARQAQQLIPPEYPEPWLDEFNVGISKALSMNKISGCGQYRYRGSTKNSGEYLVQCTRDGVIWLSYLVWTRTEAVVRTSTESTK